MFGYTNFTAEVPTTTKPKTPTAASRGRKASPTSRPLTHVVQPSPLNPRLRPAQKQTKSKSSSPKPEISHRFTNSSFSRMPSPPGVTIRTGSASKGTRNGFAVKLDEKKEDSKVSKFRPVKERRSDIIKCPQQTQCAMISRPRTAVVRRTADKSVQQSSSIENNVLLKVKDALANLMMQKTYIDASDLDKAMTYVKAYLDDKESANDDVEMKKIDVESKVSRMTVNLITPSRNLSSSKRDLSLLEPQNNDCKRVFARELTSLLKNESSKNVLRDEVRTLDNEGPQDVEHRNENKESLSSHLSKESKNCFAKEVLQKLDRVGDSQANNSKSLDIWKAIEEIDLRSYIKSLVKDMNQDFQQNNCLTVLDNLPKDNKKVSKILSVSKICTSDSTSSKKPEPEPVRVNNSKMFPEPSPSRVKVAKGHLKVDKSSCRVKKSNVRFQPESKIFEIKPKPATTYKMSDPVSSSESQEDLYLQRRRKQAGTKKDALKVIHLVKKTSQY